MHKRAATRLPCDLCGHKSFEAVAARDRRGRRLCTVVCRECGLVRHWHVPTDDQLRHFYAQQYRRDYHGEETPSPKRIMRAWESGRRLHAALRPFIQPPARVVEVGAGIGCTVKFFAEQGFQASGIEPHRTFQWYAAHRLRADVANRDLFDCHDIQNCDLVLLVHVIEHFRSPRAALECCHQMLRPGGLLYMECPNLAAPFAPRGRLFHYAHIHNFTPVTLETLAAQVGLERVAWVPSHDDRNLAGLWRRTAAPLRISYQHGYATTMAALQRYNTLTYHLRPSYFKTRIRKLAGYVREKLYAEKMVSQLARQSLSIGS